MGKFWSRNAGHAGPSKALYEVLVHAISSRLSHVDKKIREGKIKWAWGYIRYSKESLGQ